MFKQTVNNFILWSLTYSVVCSLILFFTNNIFTSEPALTIFEIVWHSIATGFGIMLFQEIKARNEHKPFLGKLISSPKWQHQVFYGLSFGIYFSLLMLFFKSDAEILVSLSSASFYFTMLIFIIFFTFIAGYLSWKGYADTTWSGIFKRSLKAGKQ
mgnify:CR=1 FL=1